MKKVMKKNEVAHQWAHQLQDEARNSGGNFYFKGDSIYSYGSHFVIAKHVTNKKGQKAVLFTNLTYSNTTAKHKHVVNSAVSHMNLIYCDKPDYSHQHNVKAYEVEIIDILKGLTNCRKPEKYIEPAKKIYEELTKYCLFFGLRVPASVTKMLDKVDTGEYKKYLEGAEQRRQEELRKREERQKLQDITALEEWRTFERQQIHLTLNDYKKTYIRFNTLTQNVETSKGIELPVKVAKRFYMWIIETVKAGGCNGECNHKILDFEVKEVNSKHVVIGCHDIEMNEIKTLATSLGW